MDPTDAFHPWQWPATWMHAACLRGVRDLLDWVLGERIISPFGQQTDDLPEPKISITKTSKPTRSPYRDALAAVPSPQRSILDRNTARRSKQRPAGYAAMPQSVLPIRPDPAHTYTANK